MENLMQEVLNKIIMDSSDEEGIYITDRTIRRYALDYDISFEELATYVLNNTEQTVAFDLFENMRNGEGEIILGIWDNLNEQLKVYFSDIEEVFQDLSDFSLSKKALENFNPYDTLLRMRMINYIDNPTKQMNLFESVANEIYIMYQFLEDNNSPNYQEDEDWKEILLYEKMCSGYLHSVNELKRIWSVFSMEQQSNFFPSLLELYERCEQDRWRYFEEIIRDSANEVIKKNLNTILRIGIFVGFDTVSVDDRVQLIIDSLNRYKTLNTSLPIEKIWESLPDDTQREHLQEILDYTNKRVLQEIWNRSSGEVTKDENMIKLVFNSYYSSKPEEWRKDKIKTYLDILDLNEELGNTVNFEIFDNATFSELSPEQLVRVTNYSKIQEMIIGSEFDSDNERMIRISMIRYCLNHDINMLEKVLSNIKNISGIHFNEFSLDELKDENAISGLVSLCLMNENYFNIGNSRSKYNRESILDFENWRLIYSVLILEDNEQIESICPLISKMDRDTRKRFALLQLKYGIDIEDAQVLVRKYASGFKRITDLDDEEKVTQKSILDIQRILSLDEDEINLIFEDIKGNNFEGISKNKYVTDLEKKCIQVYAKRFQEKLYHPKDEDYIYTANYGDQTISVYEVKSDFNMFVRAEGAYSDWSPPDNYLESIQRPNIRYHGNCESFIGQNMIALARQKGPIYCYSEYVTDGLIAMAPYDLSSSEANTSFSSTNGDKTMRGMDFRVPDELIDRTRHGHNEIVFERLLYDGKVFKKRMPNYVLWIKERTGETESDREYNPQKREQWEQTKKAATQLGIPIVMIDREYFAKREEEKIEHLLEAYEKKANQSSSADLLHDIIVQFENNATSLFYSDTLKEEYFTDDKRSNMLDRILLVLDEKKDKDFSAYKEDVIALYNTLEDENAKRFSVTGEAVKEDENGFYHELRETLKLEIESFSDNAKNRRGYLAQLCETARNKRALLEKAQQLEKQYKELEEKQQTCLQDFVEK